MLEHVVSGGTTTRRTEKEIEKIIDSVRRGHERLHLDRHDRFYIDCPAKNTLTAIELMADSMQHVNFEPAEFARELKVVRRELADGEVDRQRVLGTCCSRPSTRPTRPATRSSAISTCSTRTTNQTIIDFYHERYVPNNQVFVVVGDVATQQVLDADRQAVRRHAARARDLRGPGRRARPAFAARGGPRNGRRHLRPGPRLAHGEALATPTCIRLDVAAYILGEGESSRLVAAAEVRQAAGPGASARQARRPTTSPACSPSMAASRPETWQQASRRNPPRGLPPARRAGRPGRTGQGQEAEGGRAGFRPADRAAGGRRAGPQLLTAADPLFDKAYVEGIQKVTAEQVRDVARRYFVPERLNRVIIAPPGGAPKAAEQGRPQATEGEIRSKRLPNGLRVLVKRHAHLPLVNIQAFVLGGSLADDEADGRPRRAGGRHARPRHRRPLGPANRRLFRFDRRTSGVRRRPVHACSAVPRRCGRIFPARRPCSPSVSRGRPSPRTNSPRCSSLPWGPSPAGPTIRTQEISELFCRQPAGRLALSRRSRAARPKRCESSRPRTCNSTTPITSCRTTWS